MADLLRHKTNLTILGFKTCNVRIEDMGTLLLSGSSRGGSLRLLRKLKFYDCAIGDAGVGIIHQAIGGEGGNHLPLLEELSVNRNGITSVGLRLLAELDPSVLPHLRKLDLGWNQGLLNDLDCTRLFVQNMLLSKDMVLKELGIRWCGQHTPVFIAACENKRNKLQMLDIGQSWETAQPIIDQLIESLPHMNSLKSFDLNPELLFGGHNGPAVMAALRENSSIVKLVPSFDAPTRHHIALLLHRSQGLEHADTLLLPMQPNMGMPIHSKSGIWYMAFEKLSQSVRANVLIKKDLYCVDRYRRGIREEQSDDRNGGNPAVYTGASAVFKIFQKRPAILEKQLKRPPVDNAETISSSSAAAAEPQQTRTRHHHLSSAQPSPHKGSSSATPTATSSSMMMMMVDTNNTGKSKMLESLTREELITMIKQKDQTIAELADIIAKKNSSSAEQQQQKQAETTLDDQDDKKMPARRKRHA
jgi:hypothetical protein